MTLGRMQEPFESGDKHRVVYRYPPSVDVRGNFCGDAGWPRLDVATFEFEGEEYTVFADDAIALRKALEPYVGAARVVDAPAESNAARLPNR